MATRIFYAGMDCSIILTLPDANSYTAEARPSFLLSRTLFSSGVSRNCFTVQ